MATSDLLIGKGYAAVLALGDLQYESGASGAFASSYDPSWGRVRDITRPVVGSHEYGTAGAGAYFDYFGAAAGNRSRGYYSYDLGAWHLVALNSNCSIVSCAAGSAQQTWLRDDLAAHPAACTLVYWHHPIFSSGEHGNDPSTAALYDTAYAAGVDVALVGHDHHYERFGLQDSSGRPDPARGIREFVVGSGGRSHYTTTTVRANSEVRESYTYGILELTLRPDGYDWRFVGVPGSSFSDRGSQACH